MEFLFITAVDEFPFLLKNEEFLQAMSDVDSAISEAETEIKQLNWMEVTKPLIQVNSPKILGKEF